MTQSFQKYPEPPRICTDNKTRNYIDETPIGSLPSQEIRNIPCYYEPPEHSAPVHSEQHVQQLFYDPWEQYDIPNTSHYHDSSHFADGHVHVDEYEHYHNEPCRNLHDYDYYHNEESAQHHNVIDPYITEHNHHHNKNSVQEHNLIDPYITEHKQYHNEHSVEHNEQDYHHHQDCSTLNINKHYYNEHQHDDHFNDRKDDTQNHCHVDQHVCTVHVESVKIDEHPESSTLPTKLNPSESDNRLHQQINISNVNSTTCSPIANNNNVFEVCNDEPSSETKDSHNHSDNVSDS